MFLFSRHREPLYVPQNPSERYGAPAVSDLVMILLSHNDFVRLWLMALSRLVKEFTEIGEEESKDLLGGH
jgi:hypothetical protein